MNDLLRRVDRIKTECSPPSPTVNTEPQNETRICRDMVKERERLIGINADSVLIVDISSKIRKEVRRLEGISSTDPRIEHYLTFHKYAEQHPTTTRIYQDPIEPITKEVQQLYDINNDIDKDLDIISDGIKRLRTVTDGISNEIEIQEVIIGNLDNKVEKTQDDLDTINRRMRIIIDKIKPGSSMVIYCIIIVVILGVGSQIYKKWR